MAGVTGCKKVSLSFELVISVFLFFSGYWQGGKKGAERLKQQLTFGSGAVQFSSLTSFCLWGSPLWFLASKFPPAKLPELPRTHDVYIYIYILMLCGIEGECTRTYIYKYAILYLKVWWDVVIPPGYFAEAAAAAGSDRL